MFYAAVFVRLRRERASAALATLRGLEGIEVHHLEPSTGRLILTCEATTLDAQTSRLADRRWLDGVLVAEPVYAYPDLSDASSRPSSTASGALA